MPLPSLDINGDLPEGLHRATIGEVVTHFGGETARRRVASARLLRVYELARATGKLDRLVIFGSFVTSKAEPNDVDILLVMRDDFHLGECEEAAMKLFDHLQAQREFGASVFWIRPSMLILETLEEFLAFWQTKRDGTRRGIVEVKA